MALQAVRGDGGTREAERVASHVIDVPDFPKPGVVFKDLSPLFADAAAFRDVIDGVAAHFRSASDPGFDVVAGIEARGFLLAAALGYATGTGIVPIRKAGKLPRETHSATYALEYGTATLEVHTDAFAGDAREAGPDGSAPGRRVLVVDDVLATGGTAAATFDLVERAGGVVAGFVVLLELGFLGGRGRLTGRPVHAVLTV
jgi:adenine phosphoribosyltransferase